MPLGSVESFRVGSDWDAYVRRVQQFIVLNKIEEKLHVASLVTLVGAECYELMCDLCAPDKPETKKFDELVKLVKDHLEPERSENAVRTIKRVLKKAVLENEDDSTALSRFLFTYRNTEHSTTKREPAVALLGRRLRGRLDLLRPDAAAVVRAAQQASERRHERPLREAASGDAVLVRDYGRGATKWAEGVVIERDGPVSYAVRTSDGRVHKRHVDQLHIRKSRFSSCDLNNESTERSVPDCSAPGQVTGTDVNIKDGIFPVPEGARKAGEDEVDDEYGTPPPGSPKLDDRFRRKAALQCLEKLKKK